MIIHRSTARQREIPDCHGGMGSVVCTEYLEENESTAPGITLVHDDILPPGVSIGEHLHSDDEEVYVILEGTGSMTVDGVRQVVTAGDVCVTRAGHSHSLINSGQQPLRLLVVGARVGTGYPPGA